MIGTENQEDEQDNQEQATAEADRPRRPRIHITNSFSWVHNLPWGGTFKALHLCTIEDVKKRLYGKRVEAFLWPDMNLMGKLALYGVLPTPTNVRTPREAEEMLEGAFFDFVTKELIQQTGHFVREVHRPQPLEVGRSIILCQMVMPESEAISAIEVVSAMIVPAIKTFWFEVTALELVPKPEGMRRSDEEEG